MKGHRRTKDQIQDERVNEIVKLKVAGLKIEQICEKLALTRSQVYRSMSTDIYDVMMLKTRQAVAAASEEVTRQERDDILKSVEDRIKLAASSALTVMVEKLDSENEFVQVKAAGDLMDRDSRMSKTKKVQSSTVHAFVTSEQLIQAARVAREIQSMGRTVEALPITHELMGVSEEEPVGTD